MRDESLSTYKKSVQQKQVEAEQKLVKKQRSELDLEVRKLNRRKLTKLQNVEMSLLQEVRIISW